MKTKKIIILLIIFLIVGVLLFLIISGFGKPKLSSILVQSNLITDVFIDGKRVGQTPYTGTHESSEIVLALGSYQTRINLVPGIKTVVERDFDESRDNSSGEILSFEKTNGNETSLAIITYPDLAFITLDGLPRGNSPLKINGLAAGTHNLGISINGYTTRNFAINLVANYKLTADIDLLPTAVSQKQTVPTTSDVSQIFVRILDTPNGFLRVRSEPTTASNEIGQVNPGKKYQLIKTDEKTGWYDIQLTATSSGWISNTYATKD